MQDNYIQMHESPRNAWETKDAERMRESLKSDAYLFAGIMRWKSNDRIPPVEILEYAEYLGYNIDLAKCKRIQDKEIQAFLEQYREACNGPSEEERMEARAVHGPGVTLVNIVTGKRWTT